MWFPYWRSFVLPHMAWPLVPPRYNPGTTSLQPRYHLATTPVPPRDQSVPAPPVSAPAAASRSRWSQRVWSRDVSGASRCGGGGGGGGGGAFSGRFAAWHLRWSGEPQRAGLAAAATDRATIAARPLRRVRRWWAAVAAHKRGANFRMGRCVVWCLLRELLR